MGFICNKEFTDSKALLKQCPDLLELDDQLSSDFDRNNINFGLFFIYNNKKYTQWQDLSALINNHNGSLIMPKFSSFL